MKEPDYPLGELSDDDILRAEAVLKKLHEKQRTSQPLEAFRKEIVERFAEIGLEVFAKVYDTNEDGVFAFEVEIRGRTIDPGEYDYDKQVYNVVHDTLDLLPNSEKGQTIKSSGLIVPGGSHKH